MPLHIHAPPSIIRARGLLLFSVKHLITHSPPQSHTTVCLCYDWSVFTHVCLVTITNLVQFITVIFYPGSLRLPRPLLLPLQLLPQWCGRLKLLPLRVRMPFQFHAPPSIIRARGLLLFSVKHFITHSPPRASLYMRCEYAQGLLCFMNITCKC